MAVTQGNETGPGAVLGAQHEHARGPAAPTPADGMEAWAVVRPVTVHAGEAGGRGLADVFSCRPFGSDPAAAVAVAHLGGTFALRLLHR